MTCHTHEPPPIDRLRSAGRRAGLLATHQCKLMRFEAVGVDVWAIHLPSYYASLASFRQILSPDEHSRADRFHSSSDQARFIIAHGALRLVLADYTQTDPTRLSFVTGRHGKPMLAYEEHDVRFNLSHSGDMAVIAVAMGADVGIDIERIAPGRFDLAIAERYFSSHEISALMKLPEADRQVAFFTCWTRKEAYIKGRGEGLSIPLRDFDVSLAPGEPAALLASRIDPLDVDRWRLFDVPNIAGFVTSFAAKRSGGSN